MGDYLKVFLDDPRKKVSDPDVETIVKSLKETLDEKGRPLDENGRPRPNNMLTKTLRSHFKNWENISGLFESKMEGPWKNKKIIATTAVEALLMNSVCGNDRVKWANQIRDAAATTIQKWVRGRQARVAVKKRKEKEE